MELKIELLREALQRIEREQGYGVWAELGRKAGMSGEGVKKIAYGETGGSLISWNKLHEAFPSEIPEPAFIHNLKASSTIRTKTSTPVLIVESEDDISLSKNERSLIKALREIDPIRRRGVIITALDQLNASLQDKEIKRNRNKKKLIQDAIKDLSKTLSG